MDVPAGQVSDGLRSRRLHRDPLTENESISTSVCWVNALRVDGDSAHEPVSPDEVGSQISGAARAFGGSEFEP
jgi:hypothetical protein